MRVFVLGAGASFHAGYPLARDLGTALADWVAKNPRSDRLYWMDVDELNTLFPSLNDFEDVVSELQKPTPGSRIDQLPQSKRGDIIVGIREALCEYFDVLRENEAPLYQRFAEEMVRPGDTVITFNYDVSLEAELRRAQKWHIGDGYGFSLGEDVTPPSPIKVLKLHGSTSWIDILFDGIGGGSYGAVGPDGPLGARPLILPQYFTFFGYSRSQKDPRFRGGGSSRSGSMVLPARIKDFNQRQRFWDHLWSLASHALQEANEVMIIGYSLPSADKRARNLLLRTRNKDARTLICSGNDSLGIAREFTEAGFTRVEKLPGYFDDMLRCHVFASSVQS